MKSEEIWKYIHSERGQMAETWAELTPRQWAAASWCEGWSVQDTAGHILAAAEQTPANFFKEMTSAGFKFNVFADRAARRLAAIGPDEAGPLISLCLAMTGRKAVHPDLTGRGSRHPRQPGLNRDASPRRSAILDNLRATAASRLGLTAPCVWRVASAAASDPGSRPGRRISRTGAGRAARHRDC